MKNHYSLPLTVTVADYRTRYRSRGSSCDSRRCQRAEVDPGRSLDSVREGRRMDRAFDSVHLSARKRSSSKEVRFSAERNSLAPRGGLAAIACALAVDRWPPAPARANDRLVLDTGSISWFICGTQGCHLLSRVEAGGGGQSRFPHPERERGKGGRGRGRGSHENLYAAREARGCLYERTEGWRWRRRRRVDLIR